MIPRNTKWRLFENIITGIAKCKRQILLPPTARTTRSPPEPTFLFVTSHRAPERGAWQGCLPRTQIETGPVVHRPISASPRTLASFFASALPREALKFLSTRMLQPLANWVRSATSCVFRPHVLCRVRLTESRKPDDRHGSADRRDTRHQRFVVLPRLRLPSIVLEDAGRPCDDPAMKSPRGIGFDFRPPARQYLLKS
jgi:hypothetical protein